MKRGIIFCSLLLVLTSIVGVGFFVGRNKIFAAENQLFLNNGDVITAAWQCLDCWQKESGGNNFIVASSSQFQLISPELDLQQYASATFYFKSRTYYGTNTEQYRIDLYISVDSGVNWLPKASFYPQSNNFSENVFSYDLAEFKTSKVMVKLMSPGVCGRNSVGFDDLFFAAILPTTNQSPVAIAALSTTTAVIGEEVTFDGSGSYDPDGDNLSWLWDLAGDLVAASTTSKVFDDLGVKPIYFWVSDSQGASSSLSFNLSVIAGATSSVTTTPTTTPTLKAGDLLINEIYPAPPTGESEWLELYNVSSSTIDLAGLYLLDAKNSTTTLSGSIASGQYLVIENINGNLNNDGDTIVLRNNDLIISQTSYGDFSNKRDQSWARTETGDYAATIKITKGAANIIEVKPASSGGSYGYNEIKVATSTEATAAATTTQSINYRGRLIINEVYPNPQDDSEEEFIELKNLGDATIKLNGLYLSDNTKTRHLIKSAADLLIEAGGLAVIKKSSSSIALNNSGFEAVNLYEPEGELIDRVTYDVDKSKGQSYARNDQGEWLWTTDVTPGEENVFTNQEVIAAATAIVTKAKATSAKKSAASYGLVELEKIPELDDGAKVIVRGVVSAEPGVLGSQVFYIAGSGLQVYCYKKDFPDLNIGDYIEVSGELSTAVTGRRLKIKDRSQVKIIEQRQAPSPHELNLLEINSDYENSLVATTGEVIEIKSRSIFLDDGESELEIYVKSSINFKDLNLQEGDKLRVSGIVVKNKDSQRLLPRSLADFEVIKGQVKGEFAQEKNPNQSNKLDYYLGAVSLFLVGLVAVLYFKLNKKQ